MNTSTYTGGGAGPRLDAMTVGPFHRRMLALIGAGLFLDGFELYLTAGVLGALTKSGRSTMSLNAGFVMATFIGMMIGAWTAGIPSSYKNCKSHDSSGRSPINLGNFHANQPC